MAAPMKKPRLSVNKLGEYLVVGPARRRRIIYDAKFPSDAIRPYYQPATEAVSQFIAGGMADMGVIEQKIDSLGKMNADTVWEQRRISGNIDALDSFMNMIDDIDLLGASPELGAHSGASITINGIELSVRPEIVLTSSGGKAGPGIGGIKLHFPKANPLSAAAAGYVSAATHAYCAQQLSEKGPANSRLCIVLDVSSGSVYAGPTTTRQRMKDVQAACSEIAGLWPSVTP